MTEVKKEGGKSNQCLDKMATTATMKRLGEKKF
jgi:hypothetical protein